MEWILIPIGVLCLWLITRWWFWLIITGIAGLAAFFATIASVIHFQIFGALGFCFIAIICHGLFCWIGDIDPDMY